MANNPDIKYLFEPRTVAVIGASHNPEKIGSKILANIIRGGYEGKIYPINPKGGEIQGIKAYKSVSEIDDEIDVAVVAIPSKFVFDAVKECADNKVKFIPLITSGFSEIGNGDEENRIVEYARSKGTRILGPNILGILSAPASLSANFGPENALKGNVAIISQSGALGISLMGKTVVENMGLSAFLSIGNKADLDETDLLEYLMDHDGTKVIMMYLEGVKRGDEMVKMLKKATKKKPVVVVKSGRSNRGALAAASHTGSLAGSDDVFDAVMRQCNVLRAESLNVALSWCKFFANAPIPTGEETVIITNGGGLGVLATDAAEKYGVKLYDDLDDLKETFKDSVPAFGSSKNPVDITAALDHTYYDIAIKSALKNDKMFAVPILYCQVAVCDIIKLREVIEENYRLLKDAKKPLIFAPVGDGAVDESMKYLRDHNVPVAEDPYEAMSCIGAMYKHYRTLKEPEEDILTTTIDVSRINEVIDSALEQDRTFLLAHEAQEVMDAANVTIPQSKIALDLDEAIESAETIGYPVVMKVVSKDIIHKSDAGGVKLSLKSKEDVSLAYDEIMKNCKAYKADAVIEGVQIDEMVQPGTEIIIGARRDPSFGPIIMFGMGGVYVEVMKDISFRALPLERGQIVKMMEETHAHTLLKGVRGENPKDIDSVIDTIVKIGEIIQQCDRIADIEVNPVVAYDEGKGIKAVDVRILLSEKKE